MVGTFVAVVMVVLSTLVATPADGGPQDGSVDAQVLGQIEARGRESASSAGRSTNAADPTPGLSDTEGPTPPTATPTPTVIVSPTVTAPPTPPVAPTAPAAPTVPAPPTAPAAPTVPASPTATVEPDAVQGTLVDPRVPADDEVELIGAEALTLIPYDWEDRLPGWRISFSDDRDDVRGLTYSAERRIEVYVRDGDTAFDVARVIAHELGHAVDLAHGSSSTRQAWRAQRSIDDDTPWWPGSGAADFATGAGDFAECFASWLVGSRSLSQVAGPCTSEDLATVAALS